MARAALVILLLLFSACGTGIRRINICILDVPNNTANCARNNYRFTKKIKDMAEWSAMSENSYQIIADKLIQCEIDNKLPKEDILYKIEICEISADASVAFCTLEGKIKINEMMYIDDYIATDETGLNKIEAKLNFCMRDSL